MRNNAFLYFPKKGYSEFDAVAPLMLELSQKQNNCYTFIFDKAAIKIIEDSSIHKRIFIGLGKILYFVPKKISKVDLLNYISYVGVIFKFISTVLLLGLKFKDVYVLINWTTGTKNQSYKNDLLYKMIMLCVRCIGAKVYSFPGIQAPHTKSLLERLSPEGARRISKFEKLEKGKEIIPRKYTEDQIVFTEEHKKLLINTYGVTNKVYNIGIPRLYTAWQDHVKKYGLIDYRETLKELEIEETKNKIITILVTNPDYPWFKKNHDFYTLLREAIQSIRVHFPNEIILIKAKQSIFNTLQNHEILKSSDNVYLYKRSLASLSVYSLFCVSIAESSGIFDFLTTSVPVIEYSDYTDEYLELFSSINPWKGSPGFFIAHDVDKLTSFIRKIHDKEISSSNEELSKYYRHRKNLQLFAID